MLQQAKMRWAGVLVISVLMGACITLTGLPRRVADRGIRFSHAKHTDTDCETCHEPQDGGRSIPGHDVCTVCHDMDPDSGSAEACAPCHTRPDQSFDPLARLLDPEVLWNHRPHVAQEGACGACHADPDKGMRLHDYGMAFCMKCHEQLEPPRTGCAVCHNRLRKDVVPRYRDRMRIPHDSSAIWENVHGREAAKDPEFCNYCHDRTSECEVCHRQTPPKDHTLAWRRRTHGLQSSWDRTRCATCHEEDFCVKCHRNTEPSSHRAAWGRPINRHCLTCHYPPERTNCIVCHGAIEHRNALPSPHSFGVFPANCRVCHPAGLPHQAPHPLNSTVRCVVCH